MVTQTLTGTVINTVKDTEQYAQIVRVIRNMNFLKLRDQSNIVVPVRTEAHPSPMKQSASNRQPGQTHTRSMVSPALNHELATARYLMDDLADHVFGGIVSTDLAKDILRQFVDDEFVRVFKGTSSRHDPDDPLEPSSEEVQGAIEQAFEDANMHDCIRQDAGSSCGEPESSSTDKKGKGKKKQPYTFEWEMFPKEPIDEDELVNFLNEITDRAFDFAQPRLADKMPRLKNRFATRTDKNHAMPLSYEPDGEDMRPDFLLLPAEAFSADFKTVDRRYLNFTASHLVGEAKNKDVAAGIEQVQRYARGLRRAQPWVHYVLAMVMTKDKAVFIRGEGSGTERLELVLSDGRGCIEFIRILLGLALAEDVDLGQNPDVELGREIRTCEVNNAVHHPVASNVPSTARASHATGTARTEPAAVSSSSFGPKTDSDRPISSRTRSASTASKRGTSAATKAALGSSYTRNPLLSRRLPSVAVSSASSKRLYSETGDDTLLEKQKKRKVTEIVVTQQERMVFFPLRVYRHTCLGILFTSSSIRGRGTTVFCVLDLGDENVRLALKMSWQDLERVPEQTAVLERLKDKSHPNIIVPIKEFNATRKEQICTTLGAIRGLLDEQIDLVHVENRVLNVSVSELKRPVKYFWGVHDFVRGLRGALLGHQFLTSIGILHRDISENNIVLGVYPWEERGYLIDLDMAILQSAEEPTRISSSSTESIDELVQVAEESSTVTTKLEEKQHVKALRTGTFPYISYNVLRGKTHTHFDDVESFLYVLLFFFFSYAGPLPKEELQDAQQKGFVRPTGYGRLFHMRSWPHMLADWADGDVKDVARWKSHHIIHPQGATDLIESPELLDSLRNNWPEALLRPIRSLLQSTFLAFNKSVRKGATVGGRTELSHARFVKILDMWLETYAGLENEYSNCPDFEDPRLI